MEGRRYEMLAMRLMLWRGDLRAEMGVKGVKIWLDDERQPPNGSWTWIKTGEETIETLKCERVDDISLDHDLGDGMTGYDVAKWLEEMASDGAIDPMRWAVHSANPVGRKNIEAAMRSAEKFWHHVEDDGEDEVGRRAYEDWR